MRQEREMEESVRQEREMEKRARQDREMEESETGEETGGVVLS